MSEVPLYIVHRSTRLGNASQRRQPPPLLSELGTYKTVGPESGPGSKVEVFKSFQGVTTCLEPLPSEETTTYDIWRQ